MAFQLIDIGINLMHKSFNADRDQVVSRAAAAGVSPLIITGSSERSSSEAMAYASQKPGLLYSTAGVHPHDARHCTSETLSVLRKLAENSAVVAIGECGLDYYRDFSPRPDQDRWFEAQVQLACELQKPLFLHERDAHDRFVEILNRYADRLPRSVVHCFTGSEREMDAYLALGFYIGITGWICDERRGVHLRELVKRIPLDRLMLETDGPFLTPRDMRPQPKHGRNEPAFLLHILGAVASSMGKPLDEVAEGITRATKHFFGITS